MRAIAFSLSLVGTLLFGGALAISYADPITIERAAREIVRLEIERRVGEKIKTLTDSRIAGLAKRALARSEIDISRAQQALQEDVPRKVANVIADMLNADCECRKRMVANARQSALQRFSTMNQLRGRLIGLIESAYTSVTQKLLREFRIFTASNALAFVLLGMVTLVQKKVNLQLALPAVVLVGAVVLSGSLYLYNQDWLHTIVFANYLGFGYTAYLTGVAALLSDLVFNRARVTTRIVNWMLQAMGSAATSLPC